MKKLVAISVMLVLLTGAAFAQISGDLFIATHLVEGNDVSDSDISMGRLGRGGKWGLTFGEAPGTGRVVYRIANNDLWGWFAWRPIDLLRIKLGHDRDGEWGRAQISGWGFTAGAKDLVAISDYGGNALQFGGASGLYMSEVGRASVWYPGIGDGEDNALSISLYPMDGLQINFAIPKFADAVGEMSAKISTFHASLFYNIEDIGQATLGFVGLGGLEKDQDKNKSVGNVYASFYLTAIDGVRLDLGFRYNLPWETAAGVANGGGMMIGLGLNMPSVVENLSFKLRAGAGLSGKTSGADNNTEFMVNILPAYTISPGFVFYFFAGMGMVLPAGDGDSAMGWFVNPYISYRAGGITFWAGLKVDQRNNQGTEGTPAAPGTKNLRWAIPFGFSANY